MAKLKQVNLGFSVGYQYRRTVRELAPGALADVANMVLDPEQAMIRAGSMLIHNDAWGTGTRVVAVMPLRFPSGTAMVVAFNDAGEISYVSGRSLSATMSTSSSFADGTPKDVRVATAGDAAWFATGVSRPIRFDSLKPANDWMWAGCEPPPISEDLDDITGTAQLYQTGGLGQGRYYYGLTYLHGRGGEFGESALGQLGTVYVGSDIADEAEVVLSLPAAETGLLYHSVTGRRLYRTMADSAMNGPFYFIDTISGTGAVSYSDRYNDDSLSGEVIAPRYLADDKKIPPSVQYLLYHQARMIFASTPAQPLRFWWSESETPDLTPSSQSLDVAAPSGDRITGIVLVRGTPTIFTESTASMVQIAGTQAAVRLVERERGCIAPKSLVSNKGVAIYLSSEGVMAFDGVSAQPLNAEAGLRELFQDYCQAPERAAAAVFEDRYYLAYADSRDEPADLVNTRLLVCDLKYGSWTVFTGIYPRCFGVDVDRLLYGESRPYARVLQLGIGDTDYDIATTSAIAIAGNLLTGNVAQGLPGKYTIFRDWLVDATVPAGSLTITEYRNQVGTTGASLTQGSASIYGAADGSITAALLVPEPYLGRGKAKHSRSTQIALSGSSTTNGQYSIQGLAFTMAEVLR